ncbi:MAG: DegV family protein [Clostridiales bacterium]|jgi:DegV family protein with EDD domain|nr:DegV family protein [Clostridiales bacterium]
MASFKLIADSAFDLTDKQIAESDIEVVPFYISTDNVNYRKDRVDIDLHTLYAFMNNKVYPKTSMPSMQDYLDAFRKWLSAGVDVLCLTITSKFSSSYQSAVAAQSEARAEFPERSIIVVDTRQCTMMYGITLMEAAKLCAGGVSIEQCAALIEAVKNECGTLLTTDSLDFLVHGGRVGKVAAFAGTLFNIKPIIEFSDGELHPLTKVRGRKKSFETIVDLAVKKGLRDNKSFSSCVLHCEHQDEAEECTKMLRDAGIDVDYEPQELGAVISSHIGPTTIAFTYAKKLKI